VTAAKQAALWCLWLVLRVYAFTRPKLVIAPEGKLYLTRWYLTPYDKADGKASWFAAWYRRYFPCVYLHCFHASDPDRGWHSHPWEWATSLILRGRYLESRNVSSYPTLLNLILVFNMCAQALSGKDMWPGGVSWDQKFGPGDVNTLSAKTFHRVKLITPRVWTLFVAGPLHGREWEFMAEDGTRRPHGTETPGD